MHKPVCLSGPSGPRAHFESVPHTRSLLSCVSRPTTKKLAVRRIAYYGPNRPPFSVQKRQVFRPIGATESGPKAPFIHSRSSPPAIPIELAMIGRPPLLWKCATAQRATEIRSHGAAVRRRRHPTRCSLSVFSEPALRSAQAISHFAATKQPFLAAGTRPIPLKNSAADHRR